MFLEVFSDNPFDTNCWMLAADERDEAIVVDPGFEPDRILRLLDEAGKRPAAVLATHGHFDHIGSAAAVCGTDVPFYIHKDDELALTDSSAWGAGFPIQADRPNEVRTVSEGDVVREAGLTLEVIHTPGHTPGSVCFRLDQRLLTGDLVFRGAIGRSDFPNSSERQMMESLRRFLTFPDEWELLPGHGETSTVEHERRTNPFLTELR